MGIQKPEEARAPPHGEGLHGPVSERQELLFNAAAGGQHFTGYRHALPSPPGGGGGSPGVRGVMDRWRHVYRHEN